MRKLGKSALNKHLKLKWRSWLFWKWGLIEFSDINNQISSMTGVLFAFLCGALFLHHSSLDWFRDYNKKVAKLCANITWKVDRSFTYKQTHRRGRDLGLSDCQSFPSRSKQFKALGWFMTEIGYGVVKFYTSPRNFVCSDH